MAFRSISASLKQFNSATSSDFLSAYENFVDAKVREERSHKPSRTFAPSSMRCQRRSWFRLRGAEVDSMTSVDTTLDYTAQIGTAIHKIIQENLKQLYGDDWVDVAEYLQALKSSDKFPFEFVCTSDGLESKVKIVDPPIQFAVDGIWRKSDDLYYIVEIKTCEFSTFQDLSNPKDEHMAQVASYATFLGTSHVLFIYVDRQYGGIKCFEHTVPPYVLDEVTASMRTVIDCVKTNIPPDRLPTGDKWCSSNMCPYYKKCKEWG